jgi:predicted short-subunit dehydrogenase-like oxidoreductase (DUF2520 family)
MLRIAIVGVGRVGGALTRSLAETGSVAVEAYDRGRLAATPAISSDIVVLSIPDRSLREVAPRIEAKIAKAATVLHTSGSLSSNEIAILRTESRSVGSMHPLVSLNGVSPTPNPFDGVYFGLEGDPEAVDTSREIVSLLGGQAILVPAEKKALYHAAAVAACGHVTSLLHLATEMMRKSGVDDPERALLPLVQSTLANIAVQGTSHALTGTFARADAAGLERQIRALDSDVDRLGRKIYLDLGLRSLELALANGASPSAVEEMRQMIAMAQAESR